MLFGMQMAFRWLFFSENLVSVTVLQADFGCLILDLHNLVHCY